MMLWLFWGCVALIIYTYVGFPLWVLLRGWLRPRTVASGNHLPSVSVIIAAHNEAAVIGRKIESVLAVDYPRDQLELIVASDGSTDGTQQVVREYALEGVRLLDLPRGGKAKALNAAVAASRGEILVFSDANSIFDRQAVRALARPLADPQVGGVAGDQRYETSGDAASCGERGYWDFDRMMKRAESRAGNVISATGALYAIRRSLFQEVPEGVTDDFVTSTRVIAQRHRLVFAEDAIAWEPVAASQGAEFGRKVRVMTRGLRAVVMMRGLLNPFRHGFYALQLFSHKVLRRLMVLPLIVLLLSSVWLWPQGSLYQLAAASQVAFYSLAAAGAVVAWCGLRQHKLVALPMYFCLVNLAALVAVFRLLSGRQVVLWEPQRAEGERGVVTS